MKRFKYNVFVGALVGAISLSTLVSNQVQANPIWDVPANNPNTCMADAYFATGGKGLKNVLGAALNCTANDVEITTVTVKQVDGNDPDPEGNFTCTKNNLIQVTADLRVRTNANERWDTTFYLPLNQESPQVIQQKDNVCSIVIPKPEFAIDPDSGVLVAQELDGDLCGDIAKGPLTNDEYTLTDATFTMLCDGGDDTQVDFIYCAGWDNQERNNCQATGDYPGQEPNTTSKCNCGDIPLNIFIQPDPPLVTKTLISGSPASEPTGTYLYKVKVETQSPEANLTVIALSDYVWSLTDSDNSLYSFDLTSNSNVKKGNVTLLGSDTNYTCDEVSLPKTLNAENLAFECFIVAKIDDDDLPDDQSDELYRDVIKVIAKDDNEDNIGECVEPLTGSTVDGSCSNAIEVAIQDVTPSINIDKFAIAGPNYQCMSGSIDSDGKCSGVVYINEPGGDVTYKLIITNTSSVDPLTITSLADFVSGESPETIDLLANIVGNTCNDSLPIHLAINGASGDSFTCQFVRDVSGGLGTTVNTATVNAIEKTGYSEGNTATHNINASVTMIDVPPMVTLLKEVKTAGDPDTSFAATTEVNEPGGDVVYRFTITNTSPAQESIDLLSLTDAVLAGSRVTQGVSDCAFDGTVTISYGASNAYSCTIAASVTGDPNNNLVNTAYVTITDGESNLNSNDSIATVTFKNIPADAELTVKLAVTAFVTIKNTSTFEAIKLTQLKLLGSNITTADYTHFNVINGGYGGDFDNDGESYSSCDQPDTTTFVTIAANSSYRCAFTVELLTDANLPLNLFSAVESGGTIQIRVEDFDGGPVDDESVQAVVHLKPNP